MKTLFLYLDGFGYNYLNYTPFLKSLAKKSLYGNVNTEPLHQFEFSIFTSKHQRNHNLFAWYYFNPEKSPYKFLKYFPIDNQYSRKIITYILSLKRFFSGKTRLVSISNIPFNIAPNFAPTSEKTFIDKNPVKDPTVFDILRENNIQYLAHEWPMKSTNKKISLNPFVKTNKKIVKFLLKNQNKDFLFAHFTILDAKMHKFGLYHEEVIKELKDLDNQIKKLIEKIKADLLVILSDHGMIEIKDKINIKELLLGEDCLAFYDSDIVRIWTKDIEKIKNKLKTKKGKVYTKKNMNKIGIKYNKQYTGDIMFLANPGIIISPNYFDDSSKAMHGYIPTKEQDALLIINHKDIKPKKLKNIKLINAIPTILKLLKLKIPKTMNGKSLL